VTTPSLWTTPEDERQGLAALLVHAGRCQDLVERINPIVRSPVAAVVLRASREIGTTSAAPTTATLLNALRNNCPLTVPLEEVASIRANDAPAAGVSPAPAIPTYHPSASRARWSPAEIAALVQQHAFLIDQQRRREGRLSNLLTDPPPTTLLGRIRHHLDEIDKAQALDAARAKIRQHAQRMPSRSFSCIDFAGLNKAAAPHVLAICERLLPGGEVRGNRYVALNPTREDRHLGSFQIEIAGEKPGRWADWALTDARGDIIDLIAYLGDETKSQAAHHLRCLLGISATPDATDRYAPITSVI